MFHFPPWSKSSFYLDFHTAENWTPLKFNMFFLESHRLTRYKQSWNTLLMFQYWILFQNNLKFWSVNPTFHPNFMHEFINFPFQLHENISIEFNESIKLSYLKNNNHNFTLDLADNLLILHLLKWLRCVNNNHSSEIENSIKLKNEFNVNHKNPISLNRFMNS